MALTHNSLPQHLWEEIMAWLPPKSLLRSKSVSKSWRAHIASLLDNPSFVANHLRNAAGRRNRLFYVLFQTPTPLELSVVAFEGRRGGEYARASVDIHASHLSHCNGLVLVDSFIGRAVLYNPAVNEWSTVAALPGKTLFWLLGSGLGFDSEARDYKIVRFETDMRSQAKTLRARVYSLSTDSWTASVTAGLEFDPTRMINGAVVFSKGRCYCTVWGPEYTLISFDLSREEFGVVPLPEGLQLKGRNAFLAAWKESLAMITCPSRNNCFDPIEIWANGGESGSWTKKHCIFLNRLWKQAVNPYCWRFWTDDELIGKDTKGRLILYDLRSQELEYLTIPGVHEEELSSRKAYQWPISCVDSLISVQPGKKK